MIAPYRNVTRAEWDQAWKRIPPGCRVARHSSLATRAGYLEIYDPSCRQWLVVVLPPSPLSWDNPDEMRLRRRLKGQR